MTETLIECRGLSVGYGQLAVVRDLDLRVDAGEVVALIGRNGAGKTSTLLALAGERSPHVDPIVEELRALGHDVSIECVPYEFQRGANQMMRIRTEASRSSGA